jgi:hypothetical protein
MPSATAVRHGFVTSPQYIRRKILRPPVTIEGLRTPLTLRDRLRGRGKGLHLLAAQQFAPLGVFELLSASRFFRARRVRLDAGTRKARGSEARLKGRSRFKEFAKEPRPLELIGRLIRPCAGADRYQQK